VNKPTWAGERTYLSEVNIPGEEDDKVSEYKQPWMTERSMWKLLQDVIKSRSECFKDWPFILVGRYLSRNELEILHNNVHVWEYKHKQKKTP